MYKVLYRKYRPTAFSQVVGQQHITSTLKNEVQTGKLSHAYLFTGSRGTGKTTCAKILARAVNCLSPVDGSPCGECEICRGLESGAILDVVEIDAASNNGVDNIRDIRDETVYAPAKSKFRVYIIDEVHMLSAGAFNALLKTLEEPPEHVMFILATTQVYKLPATILSRCQRFDFKRVDCESMVERMKLIAGEEGFELDDDAAVLIARLADGGMRDALSILDRCAGISRHVTGQTVYDAAGLTGTDHLFSLADAVIKKDAAKALSLLGELYGSSLDLERLCSELTEHFRCLMISKAVKDPRRLLAATDEQLQGYQRQCESFTLEGILHCLDILSLALGRIKQGCPGRTEMESALIKMAHPDVSEDMSGILRRISELELRLRRGAPASSREAPQDGEQSPTQGEQSPTQGEQSEREQPEEKAVPEAAQREPESAATPDSDEPYELWPQVLEQLGAVNKPMWSILIGSQAYIRGDFMLIKSENPTFPDFIRVGGNARDVKAAIEKVSSRRYRLGIYTPAKAVQKQAAEKDPLDAFLTKAKSMGVDIQGE